MIVQNSGKSIIQILCFVASAQIVLSSSVPYDGALVSTKNGQIRGLTYVTENNTTFNAFLGIPYAQPPVGDLRFRAPLPAKKWPGVYNATNHGNICLQKRNNTVKGNEDCLFLNVYTTYFSGKNEAATLLPVLVWIHGGGFLFGSGNLNIHGADRFLEKGLLVVSLNYRLGVFGFLSTENNVIRGNYALKDQVLALQWIQQNIASFGGDPKQVTIFGASAGAASVHYLRQSKRARNLFHRAIANSGNTLNPWAISRRPRQIAFRIGINNGIWTSSSETLAKKLREIDSIKLFKSSLVTGLVDFFDPLNGLLYSACLEEPSDEAVITKFSYEAQQNGDFHTGPLLHGFNSLEISNIDSLPWFGKIILELYNVFPSRLTPLDMNANKSGMKIVGNNIRSYYFQNGSISEGDKLMNFLSDSAFVRGIVKSTQLESHYSNVYLYRFSFSERDKDASHSQEIKYLWLIPGAVQDTPAARLTVERMVQMWSNFAKTGNPTPQTTIAVNVTWPVSNVTGYDYVNYLDIGDELIPSINPEQEPMEFWKKQYSDYGYPPYNTY